MIRKRLQVAFTNPTPSLLQTAFPSHSVLHEYTSDHLIIKVKVSDLVQAPIMNWQYNRPADTARCEEIAKYMYRAKKPVDTMLYLSLNQKSNQFDVVDGIHRYTALMYIKKQTDELDFVTNAFGTDPCDWLFDSYMILSIRLNATDGELIEFFQSLNKSNPIPELYVRDVKKDKKDCVEHVCHNWQSIYKTHFSASNKPQKPNINRDRFIDVLDAVYDKLHLTEETKGKLEQALQRTNVHISQNLPKLTKSIKEKCEITGCWLFIYTPDELVKML